MTVGHQIRILVVVRSFAAAMAVALVMVGVMAGPGVDRALAVAVRPCPPVGAKVTAKTARAAIFDSARAPAGYDGQDVPYGCLRRTGHLVQFPGGGGDDEYSSVRIAGRFAAARRHFDSGAPDTCFGIGVVVLNLAARTDPPPFGLEIAARYEETRGNCSAAEDPLLLATAIVVKGNGAVAYVRCDPADLGFGGPYRCSADGARAVIKHDARAARDTFKVLDTGSDITASSLTLTGGTLTWRNGPAARSARLR